MKRTVSSPTASTVTRCKVKYLIRAMSSSTIIVVKTLTKYVAERLGERAFCVVFEDDLERCWPSNEIAQATRQREIQEFAESQGWTATILDAEFGTRVIFSKA